MALNFTHEGMNLAIHLFNIDPCKKQCSRDYFYGEDELLEQACDNRHPEAHARE
jgi:hypothetical protein